SQPNSRFLLKERYSPHGTQGYGIIPPRIEQIYLIGVAVLQTPMNNERNNTVRTTRLDNAIFSLKNRCKKLWLKT
ncbi:hypothetical protein LINPERHAP1_LOCUS14809, partial [Linum perenne]